MQRSRSPYDGPLFVQLVRRAAAGPVGRPVHPAPIGEGLLAGYVRDDRGRDSPSKLGTPGLDASTAP
jgi:hypothetical protein